MSHRLAKYALLLFLPLLVAGCFRQDILTVDISVPQMGSPECRRLVMQALGNLEQDAIIRADFNLETRTATITYNSMRLALKNIEYALTHAGFDANDEIASDEARAQLPEECR